MPKLEESILIFFYFSHLSLVVDELSFKLINNCFGALIKISYGEPQKVQYKSVIV